jgi:hypothetical protein
MNDDEIEEP